LWHADEHGEYDNGGFGYRGQTAELSRTGLNDLLGFLRDPNSTFWGRETYAETLAEFLGREEWGAG